MRVPGSVLFDLDGTLTDPREGIVASLRHALAVLGVECPPDARLERFIGPPLPQVFAELLGSGRGTEIARAVELYRERYVPVGLYENRVYPGIPELLAGLRAEGRRLFVCTSKPTVLARRIVDHFGLAGHLDDVFGCELDGTRGDKADLMGWLLPRAGIAADRAVMVGDRKHDARAARAHGVTALGVTWGYGSPEELREAGALVLVDRPEEVPATVARLMGDDLHE